MACAILTLIALNILVSVNAELIPESLAEDAVLNFTGIGRKYGHSVEEHDVVTEDGYILKLFHLKGNRKPPVLLMHGIADSADTFIIRGKDSLAIHLADAGYDVWVGNTRGSKYSRRHVYLNPDTDPAFWDYSFHEGGLFDLPAKINYILLTTGEKRLQSVGHSQGTTIHFTLLSTKPEYNDKINVLIALAPVAYVSNFIPPLSTISEMYPLLNKIVPPNIHEIIPQNSVMSSLIKLVCNQAEIGYNLCVLLVAFQFVGSDAKRLEPEFLPVVIGHYPSSTSRKSLLHYGQMALSKRFCYYDYGDEGNLRRYGYAVPLDYNLRAVTTKVALIVGKNDPLSTVKDVEILRTQLPNIIMYHVMKPKVWNHIDFIWGNDMVVSLFPFITDVLNTTKGY